MIVSKSKDQFRYVSTALDLLVYGYIINTSFNSQGLSVLNVIPSILFVYAFYLLGLQIINNSQLSFSFNRLTSLWFLFYAVYLLISIIRGLSLEPSDLFTLFFNPDIGALFLLSPFAILIGKQPGVFKALVPTFKKHSFIGIFIVSITAIEIIFLGRANFSNSIISRSLAFSGVEFLYGAPLCLLLGILQKSSDILYFRVCLWFSLLGFVLTEQRFYMALTLIYILLDLMLANTKNLINAIKRSLLLIIIIGPLLLYSISTYQSNLSSNIDSTDTRSFIVEEIILDFNSNDYLFGRGALGSTYSPYFQLQQRLKNAGDSPDRQTIEIGYLHILLKTGLIGAVFYSSLFLGAVFEGFRTSQSRFTLGASTIIFIHLLELFVSGNASIYPIRIVLWVLAGSLLSKSCSNRSASSKWNWSG